MKSSVSRNIGRFGNEASRRLYRGAADVAKKLEQHLSLASSLTDLFSSEVTDLRMRLKEYCERLIFTDPVEYGKKAEDLLWRKVFYDFFYRCKQNRKKLLESEYYRNALICQLLAGIGFYHHILLRIQTEFHIDLEGKVDVPFLWHLKGVKKERWKKYQQSAASDNSVQTWANQAIHHILIYLGDLERYIAELHVFESNHLAERYYAQAFCMNSQNGTPHNQLGSLYNNRFDSAYHYMRCLSCHEKFDGAEGNLIRVFEKNDEVLQQLYAQNCGKELPKCSSFLTRFLKLCQIFYFAPGENSEIYCQDILKEFDITLNGHSYDKASLKEDSSERLTDDAVFKFVVMALMCVTKLQEQGHSDASVATAFCLALFSYIIHKTTKQLSSIYEFLPDDVQTKRMDIVHENNSSRKETPIPKDQLSDASGESEFNKDFVSKKPAGKKMGFKRISAHRLRTLRRRRKMSSTSQEDSELSEGEITELPESDEESALLNSDVSQTGSCSSESLSENEDELFTEQNNLNNEGRNEKNLNKDYIDCNESEKNSCAEPKRAHILSEADKSASQCADNDLPDCLISSEKLIQVLKKNSLLPCLKILSDWLRTNEDILSACAESSQFLLSCVIELLNLLLKIEDKLLASKDHLFKLQQSGDFWKQIYPLPEDTALQGFSLFKKIHSHLPFDICKRRELSTSSQVFLRIQCLLSFGKCLTRASESSVDFDIEKKKYYFNLCNKIKESDKEAIISQNSISHDFETRRQKLMRSMAHLWLKAEVNDLETLVEGGSAPQLSPYLVADTSVLCYNLSSLKQLIISKRFVVVVPLVVIANLDQLKKESIGAREAIRWLESELRKGCRYIRAQRQMEKISLVPMKYPRKKEKEAWDFFQILECCNYLMQQQTNGKTDCSLVTLLVGSRYHLPDNASAISQSIDVTIENIGSFFSKWKNSIKNPG